MLLRASLKTQLNSLLLQRSRQSNPVNGARILNASIATILADDEVLSVRIHEEANQVGTHIVAALYPGLALCHGVGIDYSGGEGDGGRTYKISKGLGQVTLIQVDINIEQALEVLCRMRHEVLTIGAENPPMAVIDIGVLEILTLRRVQLDSLGRDSLPWSQRERSSFNRISRSDQLSSSANKSTQCRGRNRNIHRNSLRQHW